MGRHGTVLTKMPVVKDPARLVATRRNPMLSLEAQLPGSANTVSWPPSDV
jgi:hypothetical protein